MKLGAARAGVPTSVAPGSEATVAAVTTEGAGPHSKGTPAHWPRRARRAHDAGRAAGRRRGPALRTPRTVSLGAGRSPAGGISWWATEGPSPALAPSLPKVTREHVKTVALWLVQGQG